MHKLRRVTTTKRGAATAYCSCGKKSCVYQFPTVTVNKQWARLVLERHIKAENAMESADHYSI